MITLSHCIDKTVWLIMYVNFLRGILDDVDKKNKQDDMPTAEKRILGLQNASTPSSLHKGL